MKRRDAILLVPARGCDGPQPATVSGVPNPENLSAREGVSGALTAWGCECKPSQPAETPERVEEPPDETDASGERSDEPLRDLSDAGDPWVPPDVPGPGRDTTAVDSGTPPAATLERPAGHSGGCAGLRSPGPWWGAGPLGLLSVLLAFRRRTRR